MSQLNQFKGKPVIDPWKMPDKPADQCSPEERREWLAHYDATAPERQRQSDSFYRTAVICLGAGLLVPMLMMVGATVISKFYH
jgi:hypothetical protein